MTPQEAAAIASNLKYGNGGTSILDRYKAEAAAKALQNRVPVPDLSKIPTNYVKPLETTSNPIRTQQIENFSKTLSTPQLEAQAGKGGVYGNAAIKEIQNRGFTPKVNITPPIPNAVTSNAPSAVAVNASKVANPVAGLRGIGGSVASTLIGVAVSTALNNHPNVKKYNEKQAREFSEIERRVNELDFGLGVNPAYQKGYEQALRRYETALKENPAKTFPLPDKGANYNGLNIVAYAGGQDPNVDYDVYVETVVDNDPRTASGVSVRRNLKGAISYDIDEYFDEYAGGRLYTSLYLIHGGGQRMGLGTAAGRITITSFTVLRSDGFPENRPEIPFVPSTNTSAPTGYADPPPALPPVFSPDYKPPTTANNGDSKALIAGAIATAATNGNITGQVTTPNPTTSGSSSSGSSNSSAPTPSGFSPSGQGLPPKSGITTTPATPTTTKPNTIDHGTIKNEPIDHGVINHGVVTDTIPATPVLYASKANKENEFTAKQAIEASKSPVPAKVPTPTPTPTPAYDTGLILTAIGTVGLAATAIKNRTDQIYTNTTPTAQQTNAKQGVCDSMQPSQCGFEGVKQATTEATNPIKEIANDNKGLLGQVIAAIANLLTILNTLKDFIFDKIAIILKLLNNQVVDRAVNMLNLAVNITNLLMLTESAGKALGGIVDAVFALTPLQFENDQGQKTTASSAFGQNVTAMVVNIIGADNYASLKEGLAVNNRIIKSVVNGTKAVEKLLYQQSKQQQKTGIEVANIGNALIENGVVNQNSYPKMPNSPEANAAMSVEDSNILTGKLGIVKQGIAGLKKITQEINSKVRVVKGIQKAFKNVTDLADGESKARKAIRNTAKQEAVRKSKFKSIHLREIKKK